MSYTPVGYSLLTAIVDALLEFNTIENKTPQLLPYIIKKHICVYINHRFIMCFEDSRVDEECILKLWEDIIAESKSNLP